MRAGATQPLPQGQGRGDMCCWGSACRERWYGMDQTLACPLQTMHPSSSQVALLGHCTLHHCKRGPAIMTLWLSSYDPGNRKQPNQPTNTRQHHISPAYLLPPLKYLGHTVPCPVGLSGALWTSAVRWQPKHQCAAQMGCSFQQAWCRCVPHTPLPLMGLRH